MATLEVATMLEAGRSMGSIRLKTDNNAVDDIQAAANASQIVRAALLHQNAVTGKASDTATAATKPAVNLFVTSNYEAVPKTVTLTDGSTVTLPTLSEDDVAQMQHLFGSIPTDKHAQVNAASQNLATTLLQHAASLRSGATVGGAAAATAYDTRHAVTAASSKGNAGGSLAFHLDAKVATSATEAAAGPSSQATAPVVQAGNGGFTVSQASPDVLGAMASAAQAYASAAGYGPTTGESGSYDNTVQAVTYMGIQGLQSQMTGYAAQMQTTINQESTIRTDQSELSQAVADWPSGTTTQTFTYHDVDANGNLQTYTQSLTEAQAKSEADSLSNTLDTLGSDTQMQQMELQNMMENYQQGVTTLSNVSATEYNMVKNTIGNIHY